MHSDVVSPYVGELVGTMILIIFGGGTVANVALGRSKGYGGGWIVISAGWGLGVAVAAYSVGHVSGAHLNPAISVSLAVIGSFPWRLVPGYCLSQVLGGMLGGCLVWLCYLPHWSETPDAGAKHGVFCTAPAIRRPWANLLTETIATAVLIFGILALGSAGNEIRTPGDINLALLYSKGLSPLLVGFLVWAIGLALGGPTGYAINPARDLGPRIAHALLPIPAKAGFDWSYCWIPIVGPLAGGVLSALLFTWLRF